MHDTGRRLAERYELGAVVGRGGMGTVHRARDLVLDRTVAVKLLPRAAAEGDASDGARFEREARVAASLPHHGVVAVYDAGEDDATRFIVMEFVEGRSLAEVLREDAPMEAEQAAAIVTRVAAALRGAHAAGIVHRDVKPANVMLCDDGTVKVLDFGIARPLDGSTLTQDVSVLGTAGYMAPEQALGGRADQRSDVYSLGCLLYALLTGAPPFTGESAAAVLHQHVNCQPRGPATVNRSVSPRLESAVLAMLAKAPQARPQSAGEVQHLLAGSAVAAGAPSRAPRRAGEPARHMDPTAETRPLDRRAGHPGRRRAAAGAALAAGVLLLLGIVALASGGATGHRTRASRSASTQTGTHARASSATAPRPPTSPSPAPDGVAAAPGTAAHSAPPPPPPGGPGPAVHGRRKPDKPPKPGHGHGDRGGGD